MSDWFRQQQHDELVRLQTQKLRREQQGYDDAETAKSIKGFAVLIGILFAIIVSIFVLAIKYPKTFLVLLVLGYGVLQFGAPVQGAEFNRWVVTLFTNPSKAGNELLTTVGDLSSGTSTIASPGDDNSTVSSTDNGPQIAPVNAPTVAAPTLAAPTVNPMCSKFNWSNSDDIPYLQYYKCPNPNTGN